MGFACSVDIVDGIATVHLTGEADLTSVDAMQVVGSEAIGDPTVRSVIVDCAGITFCDSTVLSVLIGWRNLGLDRDCALSLRGVPRQMMKVLRITQLDAVFDAAPLDSSG